jgi:hypothetical protein
MGASEHSPSCGDGASLHCRAPDCPHGKGAKSRVTEPRFKTEDGSLTEGRNRIAKLHPR